MLQNDGPRLALTPARDRRDGMLTGRPFGRADDDRGGERRPNSRPRADWFREEAYRKLGRRVIAVSGSWKSMLSEKGKPIEIRIADLGHLNAEAILEPLRGQVPMTPCIA